MKSSLRHLAKKKYWLGAFATLTLILLFFANYVRWSLNATGEPDRAGMLRATSHLVFTKSRFAVGGNDPQKILLRHYVVYHSDLDLYMAGYGWLPAEPSREGATSHYGKKGRKIEVYSRPFTGKFRLCEVEENLD